eukprot:16451044-Heterocapsa_arctica.AAC.1
MLSVPNWVFQEFLHGGLGGLCSSYPFFVFGNRSFELLFCGGPSRNPRSQVEPRVLIIRELVNELYSSCRHTVGERQNLRPDVGSGCAYFLIVEVVLWQKGFVGDEFKGVTLGVLVVGFLDHRIPDE